VWEVTGTTLGIGYVDECTTLSVQYSMMPRPVANGTTESDRTVLLKLELRTLGALNLKQSVGEPTTQDGVATR
jgi:LPS-assembly protein